MIDLTNAPEGATHYATTIGQKRYLKHNVRREFIYHNNSTWCAFTAKSKFLMTCNELRSLSDLREILALREENEKLKAALLTVANWRGADKE